MRWPVVLALWVGFCANSLAADGRLLSVPVTYLGDDGRNVAAESGFFRVLENRARPAGRSILVHFVRFPASKPSRRPPVFLLAGGPGAEIDFENRDEMHRVELLRRTRDVVYVSQRGNPDAPGLSPNLRTVTGAAPLDHESTVSGERELQRTALKKALKQWTDRGLDLAGYDILNIVDDVYELRAALGYRKIALCGCSFGSQWSLSYIRRWPDTVERAMLGGVEPLDYAYDSPKWLWASLERLAAMAEADPALAVHIPHGGLIEALQMVAQHLKKHPESVQIADRYGNPVEIVIGVEDLRTQIADAYGFLGTSKRDNLANWPRFILELARGDYRFLAARTWELRVAGEQEQLILPLIDNSLGITAQRDALISAEPEIRWLGDINAYYHDTRDLVPTPNVGDRFRADGPLAIPVLLVNGDLDWSTSVENAEHLAQFLERGHLIRVLGGTHCSVGEMRELAPQDEQRVYTFMEADFHLKPSEEFFQTLPQEIRYPAIRFKSDEGVSLYEEWLKRRVPEPPRS